MLGERGIRMGRDLDLESRFVGGTDQASTSGAGTGPMAPGVGTLAPPAANRGWIDPEVFGDINHSMTVIHRGQGSFTDVV